MFESSRVYAVIVGIDDERGVHVARTMKRHKIPFIGIAKNRRSPGTFTRGYESIYYANTDDGEFIELLEELGPRFSQRAVLIPCFDTVVNHVSQNRERIKDWYHIMLPAQETVELIKNKVEFYKFAQENGYPVPKSNFIYNRKQVEELSDNIDYPCIVKPPDSKAPNWRNNSIIKAFKVENQQELLSFFDKYKKFVECLIVQEFIPGTDEDVYNSYVYFNSKSEPIVSFTSRKLRQWPPETGVGCFAEEVRVESVLKETVRMMQDLRFHGICGFEMKRSPQTGKFSIIEANIGRPGGRLAHIEGSGIESLYTIYCDAIGRPLPFERIQQFNGTKYIHLRRDLSSAFIYWRRGELTFRDWFNSLRGRKVFGLFSWSDPVPFIADLYQSLRKFMNSKERRKISF